MKYFIYPEKYYFYMHEHLYINTYIHTAIPYSTNNIISETIIIGLSHFLEAKYYEGFFACVMNIFLWDEFFFFFFLIPF